MVAIIAITTCLVKRSLFWNKSLQERVFFSTNLFNECSSNPLHSNCNKSSAKALYPTYLSFCMILLEQMSFLRLFCWYRKHMSQSVVATVQLETRLNLRFDFFHFCTFLLKNQQCIFKNKHWKVFHYIVLSKIFRSLKNYKFKQISWKYNRERDQ